MSNASPPKHLVWLSVTVVCFPLIFALGEEAPARLSLTTVTLANGAKHEAVEREILVALKPGVAVQDSLAALEKLPDSRRPESRRKVQRGLLVLCTDQRPQGYQWQCSESRCMHFPDLGRGRAHLRVLRSSFCAAGHEAQRGEKEREERLWSSASPCQCEVTHAGATWPPHGTGRRGD